MSSPLSSPASRRGFLLVVLAALCWGTSGISGKIVAERAGLGPLDIAWHRMAIGAVVLLLGYALTTRRRRTAAPVALTRGTVVRLVLVGAGLAAYQLAYFAAVATAGVSIATLVALGLAPLLIAVGAALLGHGRPDRATVVALVVALTGLVLLVGVSAGVDTGTTVVLGALARGRVGARLRRRHPGRGGRAGRRPGHPRRVRRRRAAADAGRPGRRAAVRPPSRSPWRCCSTWVSCRARWPTRCSSPGCGPCRARSPRSSRCWSR